VKLLTVAHEDYPSFTGKRLRIDNGVEQYEGVMTGLNDHALIVTSPTTNAHPWQLKLDDGSLRNFLPSAWGVYEARRRWPP
jgi:hypothetical protein